MHAPSHPKQALHIPPPLAFLVTFVVGWWLQRYVWPHAPTAPAGVALLGKAILVAGLAFGATAIGEFALSRTTVLPHGQPKHFVVRGPYRLTRNPMYLGLSLAYAGVAAWIGAWLALPLVVLPIAYITRWVIPGEEQTLAALFGNSYYEYRRRVRRWV